MTLTIKIQKLQIICKKTSVLAWKLDKNSQSYGKMKSGLRTFGTPLKMEALFKLKSCSFVLNNQFFINFTFYSFCKISATKACDKRKKLFLMTMTAVFVCDLFLSWWFVKVSVVKCWRHLLKSRVLSCLRFERCFFFQKYLWFLGMEHKQSKCALEKKKVAVPDPIVQRKQNPTSKFLEDYFIALIGLSRKFLLSSWNHNNFVNAPKKMYKKIFFTFFLPIFPPYFFRSKNWGEIFLICFCCSDFQVGDLISTKVKYETEDKKDNDRWVPAVITSLHVPKTTCDLVVINARNYQVFPFADQVPLNDVFRMSKLGNKHLGTNIVSCEWNLFMMCVCV